MPKYMLQATYTGEGLKGLMNDTATGRRAAVKASVEAAGGKLEAMYYCFGKDDVVIIMDLPDNVTAASLAATTGASGMVRTRTTSLLTVEEMDKALAQKVAYKAPGSGR
jgi:uncharacterized protein with GYD domain